MTVTADLGTDERVLLVPGREQIFAEECASSPELSERVRVARDMSSRTILDMPLHRGVPASASVDDDGGVRVERRSAPGCKPSTRRHA